MKYLSCVMLAVFLAGPAHALEPTGNAVADALLRAVEHAGFADARAEAVKRIADSTVVEGISGGVEGGTKIAISAAAVDRGVVDADNALVAPAISYERVAISGADGAHSEIGLVTVEETRIATSSSAGSATTLIGNARSFRMMELTARSAANETIKVAAIEARIDAASGDTEVSGAEGANARGGAIAIDDFVFDLSLFEEPAASQIRALGYGSLTVDLAAAGDWAADTGKLELRDTTLRVDGMGELSLSLIASGLTEETFSTLQAAGVDFANVLETLSGVTLSQLGVAFRDEGLTERLLARATETTGRDRAAVVSEITAALDGFLATMGDAAFRTTIVETMSGFLENPGTITLSARPAQEITALQIIGATMLNPQLLPTILAIELERE